jgi:metal-sulfur cluster biosynthetic enzyme
MNSQPGTNRPAWQLEETDPELAEHLTERLHEVVDPEIGYSVVQLGLIRKVYKDRNEIAIEMILTTPFCPYGPEMIQMVREKAEEALKQKVNLSLGMEVWDFSMTEEGLLDDWGLY